MSDQHSQHSVNYFLIFIALCVLTVISIATDVIEMPGKLIVVVAVLAVATAKALFVLMYFMHLKFEGRWKYMLLAPTVILAIGLPLALLPDIGVHYYTMDPQSQRVNSNIADDVITPENPSQPEH